MFLQWKQDSAGDCALLEEALKQEKEHVQEMKRSREELQER